ncbi:hypothetical protein E2C01_077184 [Portunus trituberculatus]|uniref:Uncharacterized protein n=1 Tax=Portunus trituberculatus TaxID=210409 RepID=A0A5B7IF63_PORTR|nr:hypothetical protein [Portunus trituberculatus]
MPPGPRTFPFSEPRVSGVLGPSFVSQRRGEGRCGLCCFPSQLLLFPLPQRMRVCVK